MKLKKYFAGLTVIGSAGLCSLANTAMAADGTINFNGTILDVACTVTAGGAASGTGAITIALPNVAQGSLGAGVGTANTAFTLALGGGSNCSNGKMAAMNVEPASNLDSTTGALKSTGTSNVQVRLLNGDTGAPIQLSVPTTIPTTAGSTIASNNQPVATVTSNAATLRYIAQYYAPVASTTGTVSASLTYSMTYN